MRDFDLHSHRSSTAPTAHERKPFPPPANATPRHEANHDFRGPVAAPGEDARWYVVHTQPHSEDRAIVNLERQTFTTFCPRARKSIRHARKLTQVLAPLFPGYVFVRLDPSQHRWRSINGSRGVIRIVAQGDAPIAVPHGIVEALMARTDEDGAFDWSNSLKVGDPVRLCDGPFVELIGTLEQLDAPGRVRVLLNLMGRSVSLVVRSHAVSPIA